MHPLILKFFLSCIRVVFLLVLSLSLIDLILYTDFRMVFIEEASEKGKIASKAFLLKLMETFSCTFLAMITFSSMKRHSD